MRQALYFFLFSFLLVSCLITDFEENFDKIGKPEWNPKIGIPFISGTFTLGDYVDATSDDITVTQSQDGVVIIEYRGEEITSDYAEDLIEVPTQSFSKQTNFSTSQITEFPISGSLTVSDSFDGDITPEEGSTDIIDSVYLKAGTLLIQIETNVPADGLLDLTINTLIKDGSPITFSTGWTYNPGNPGVQTITETVDLAETFGDFTRNGTAANNFHFDAITNLTFSGQPLSPTDYIRISIDIQNPKFRLAYGKFTEREFETDLQTVGLGIFNDVAIEGFYLDKPSVEFNFLSNYGVPVEASITVLEAINDNGVVLPFAGTAIDEPTIVPGPGLDEVGNSVETELIIDKSNSNITEVISFLPSELRYLFSGKVISTNPSGTQFVLDTSRVIGNYKVVLPLDGRVARFESEQTLEKGRTEIENIGESLIMARSSNGLPVKVSLEIIFLDESGNEILALFQDAPLLEPGDIDSDGFVISPTENIEEQSLTAEETQRLLESTTVKIKTVLNTGEDGTEVVKFRMTDEVQISLYLQTSLSF